MANRITKRIGEELGLPGLLEALSLGLPGSDLQSLLLAVYQKRARRMTEAELMGRAEGSALLHPSPVDARLLQRFDGVAFAAAGEFEGIDLSPACPLGTTQVLGGIDQNNVLTTIRNAEALGDSTAAMAIECARRRRGNAGVVRLANSHRLIRLQAVDFPGYRPHFRLFAMVTAGRDRGSLGFELEHLREHLVVYLRMFRLLNEAGFQLNEPLVQVSDPDATRAALATQGAPMEELRQVIRGHRPGGSEAFLAKYGLKAPGEAGERLAAVGEHVFQPLRALFPEAQFSFDGARLEGLAYYQTLCFRISPAGPDGQRYPIVDGGFTDWTARLLGNRKERLLTSAVGTEFVCGRYLR